MYTCSIGYKIAEGQNEIFIEEKKIGEEYIFGPAGKNIGSACTLYMGGSMYHQNL